MVVVAAVSKASSGRARGSRRRGENHISLYLYTTTKKIVVVVELLFLCVHACGCVCLFFCVCFW